MNIVKQHAEIINISGDITFIEHVARTCYKSHDKITKNGESAKRLVSSLVNRGHDAMLEFVDVTVKFNTSRAIANEIVRHRMSSFAQASTRYIKYDKGIDVVIPFEIENNNVAKSQFIRICTEAEYAYKVMIENGLKAQTARSVLPLCLHTELVMKANLRSWMNFFKLRTDKSADPEMVRLASPLLVDFKKEIPIIFDDI